MDSCAKEESLSPEVFGKARNVIPSVCYLWVPLSLPPTCPRTRPKEARSSPSTAEFRLKKALQTSGEGGIRTPGTACAAQRFSRPPHSTALPPLPTDSVHDEAEGAEFCGASRGLPGSPRSAPGIVADESPEGRTDCSGTRRRARRISYPRAALRPSLSGVVGRPISAESSPVTSDRSPAAMLASRAAANSAPGLSAPTAVILSISVGPSTGS